MPLHKRSYIGEGLEHGEILLRMPAIERLVCLDQPIRFRVELSHWPLFTLPEHDALIECGFPIIDRECPRLKAPINVQLDAPRDLIGPVCPSAHASVGNRNICGQRRLPILAVQRLAYFGQ
jgi:hypothetical protein